MSPSQLFTIREEGYSMYDARTVRNSMRYLFRGAVHEHGYKPETVNALLREVDCAALAAVFRRAARRVYAFETRGRHPLPPLYRGQDLFGQWAVRIYEDVDAFTSGLPSARHALEVWLKEDGNLVTAACVRTHYDSGEYDTEYREIQGWPWGCGLELKLEVLTENLRQMCAHGSGGA